ncbi:MAG: Dabb family protein [Vicinamibacteria bacterium]|nr:Dabb family protein [Vicinamibacteria bacterium]
MRRALSTLSFAVLAAVTLPAVAQRPSPPPGDCGARPTHRVGEATKLALDHVVLFKLNPGEPAGAADEMIADMLCALPQIPGAIAVSAGKKLRDDREHHVKDYDVMLTVRLTGLEALATYASHPSHVRLVEKWRPRATWRVIDAEARLP